MVNIYALKDKGSIFYIGKCKDAKKRMEDHLRASFRKELPVHFKIQEILSEGRKPECEILMTCEDWEGGKIERAKIRESIEGGMSLTNVVHAADIQVSDLERKILSLMANDLNTDEIATSLYRSPRTIEAKRMHLKSKSKTKTVAGLIVWGIHNGIISI